MINNNNRLAFVNDNQGTYQQFVRLEIFLVTILIFLSLTVLFQSFAGSLPPGISISILLATLLFTCLYFFLLAKKRKNFLALLNTKTKTTDPVILLSELGINIQEYSDSLLQNCSSLNHRMETISIQIVDLNEKIHTAGQDIDRVYQIVSQLATEEVKLMDAVGKTSEEIDIMFEIVNIVIGEIQNRNETMENLVFLSKDGRVKVGDTNKTIKKFSESSGNILKLIDLINGVSKETNLLAINAAIEATHSGSEGKGFTVIADEIGKLSTMTANNAKQITKILKENISDYGKAEKLGFESSNAFQFIADEIHIVHGTIAEVIQSIQKLKSRGGAILSKAKTLDDIAERVRDTSGEVYGEIVTLHSNLVDIQGLSETIHTECEEIRNSQQTILLLTEALRKQLSVTTNPSDEILNL